MNDNDRQPQADLADVLGHFDGIYDLLLEGSHDMVLAIDLEGIVLAANDAACRSLGVSRDQLVGGPITNRISESVERVRGEMFRRMVERDEVVEFEDSRDGRMFHHRFVPLHRDGQPAGALFFVRETTAEHRRKQRFRAITENANDLILELDDHGLIIYANARVAAVLGKAPPDLVGKAPSSLVEPSYRQEVDDRLETLTRGLCSTRSSCPARHTSGKQVWLELTATSYRGPVGRLTIVMTCRDITAHRQALEALQQSRQRFMAVSMLGTEYAYAYRVLDNDALLPEWVVGNVMGRPARVDDLRPQSWINRIHPDDYDAVILHRDRRLRGETTELELRVFGPDGRTHWLRDRAAMVVDRVTGIRRIVGSAENITDKKEAEAALARSEQLTRQLIDSTHDVVALCNPDGVLLLVNDALEQRLGRPRRELLGTVVFDYFPPDAAIKRREYFRRAYQTGSSVSFRDDFTRNVFETTITPIREEDGTISRLGVFVRDITDRCQAEQSLIRAERMTAIGTLAAGIAHQFNNLNQIVLGNLAMTLKDSSLGPAARDQVERAHRAVKRSRGLTHNLLAFSRPREATRVATRLDELVDDALKICRRSLEQDDITVRLECQPVPPSELDPTQIEHVLLNLVMNARDAMLGRPVRELTIRVAPLDDRQARITVSDTGHGIDPDNLGKIFDPFFTTRYGPTLLPESVDDNLYGGSGLGLSIAMQIVQQHQGSLEVESAPGQGTTFTLTLPLKEPAQTAPPAAPPRRATGPAVVLVVDDEPEIRQLLAGILPKSTFSIVEADNARSAIEQVSRTAIDLVITDLQMPGQNGLHLVRVIMDIPAPRRPALVVMTGKLSVPEEKLLGQMDHCRLLLKPFEPDDLLQACYDVLGD